MWKSIGFVSAMLLLSLSLRAQNDSETSRSDEPGPEREAREAPAERGARPLAPGWHQWRGPLGSGVAPDGNPPIEWSEKKNVRWKTALPGLGHSSPIVTGERVFLTTAVPTGQALPPKYSGAHGAHDNLPVTHRRDFIVIAVNRRDGEIDWKRTVHSALPHEGGHNSASLASASPVTDGKRVVASFGSYGIYCLDLDGKDLWKKRLGTMRTKHGHGEGSSPVLHGGFVVVNWDHEAESFVAAFDIKTGAERWRVERDEGTSWATPIVVEHAGRRQVVVSGTKRIRAYDLASGETIWECGGLSNNVVASPVAAGGVVFAGSSYEIQAMLAIRLDGAKGDITRTEQIAWTRSNRTPYVPSPLLYGDSIYFLRHYQNILSRVSTKTGRDLHGPFRLPALGNIYASPVGAAKRVYVTDRRGTTVVLSHDDDPKVLAVNSLDDSFSASLAIAGKELFLRGEKWLYCVAAE